MNMGSNFILVHVGIQIFKPCLRKMSCFSGVYFGSLSDVMAVVVHSCLSLFCSMAAELLCASTRLFSLLCLFTSVHN